MSIVIRRLRKRIADLPIKHKLGGLVLMTSSVALALACTGIGLYEFHDLKRATVQEVEILVDIICDNSQAALAFRDHQAGIEVLSALAAEPSVMVACLYDSNNQVFAIYRRPGASMPHVPRPDHAGPIGFGSRTMTRFREIRVDEELLGIGVIQYDLQPFHLRVRSYWVIAGVIIAASTVIAYLLSGFLRRMITAPVLHLARVAHTVSKEERYSVRVQQNSNDEIGALVRAFNNMLSQVETRDATLEEERGNLEKRVEERTHALVIARDDAEAAARAKSEFLANISHELRTPMHGILSFANFGRTKIGKVPEEKTRNYFEKIYESGSRLLSLLNDLLDLSKLEAERMTFDRRRVNIAPVVENIMAEFESLVSENDLNLRTGHVDEVAVFVDRDKIMQVLRNLVGNAVKFSSPEGSIVLDVEKQGEFAVLSVTDQGHGVPDSELETIFDKFVQSKTTKTGAGGTGLGLAICREIIGRHSGRIWAENVPNGGATFFFTLPLASNAVAQELVPTATGIVQGRRS